MTSPLGFKARVGSALFTFRRGKCNVHSLRSTSGATNADLLAASMQPVTSPHACAEVGLGSDSNDQSSRQKNGYSSYSGTRVIQILIIWVLELFRYSGYLGRRVIRLPELFEYSNYSDTREHP